jgi:hypothetical protein
LITEQFITTLFTWVASVFNWLATHDLVNYKGFKLSFLAADLGLIAAILILKLVFGSIFSDEEVDDDI